MSCFLTPSKERSFTYPEELKKEIFEITGEIRVRRDLPHLGQGRGSSYTIPSYFIARASGISSFRTYGEDLGTVFLYGGIIAGVSNTLL